MLDDTRIMYQTDLQRVRRLLDAQLAVWPVQDEQEYPSCVLHEIIAILDDSILQLGHPVNQIPLPTLGDPK